MSISFFGNEGEIIVYIAHIKSNECGQAVLQSVKEHCIGASKINADCLNGSGIENIVRISCLLHDAGKYSDEFQTYIKKAYENPNSVRRGEVTHSTAGAQIAHKFINGDKAEDKKFENMACEFIRHALISHHGFADCITPDGKLTFVQRNNAAPLESSVSDRFLQDFDESELHSLFQHSARECKSIYDSAMTFCADKRNAKYGSIFYYLGMYERLLLSYLTDADRTDTAIFGGNKAYSSPIINADIKSVWTKMLENLDKKLSALNQKRSGLSDKQMKIIKARGEISSACRQKADAPNGIFRLTVPTGGGKTFSVMSFALLHAIHNRMKRIIYVAPYNSILEQNALELGSALDAEAYILEHHCNVIIDDDAEREKYDVLAQRWNSPIILTSAVQLLNTLFSNKMSSVRRLHSLENSVIIFDEIQSLPIRCTSLFNLSVNYLTKFCHSSVVLCSATQPPLNGLENNCMLPTSEIVEDYSRYFDVFKRTEIICDCGRERSADELADFVMDKINRSMLIVVNTKSAARRLYEAIDKMNNGEFKLYHLSTNMCAAHRRNVIDDIRNTLASGEKCICVSTQLIEAGVDISFECAVRSLSGLDSIIQTGGRCNRHGESDCGKVYVVKYSDENVSRLRDISIAQRAMEKFIYMFYRNPQNYGGSMLSPEAMQAYYKIYFKQRETEFDYTVSEYGTTLVDLLSQNSHGLKESMKKYPREQWQCCLPQAFKSAGEQFECIEEQGNIDLVVNYKESKVLIETLRGSSALAEKYGIIKKLQSYTVSISKWLYDKLKDFVEIIPEVGVRVLDERCYDEKFGVSDEPGEMQNLIF